MHEYFKHLLLHESAEFEALKILIFQLVAKTKKHFLQEAETQNCVEKVKWVKPLSLLAYYFDPN